MESETSNCYTELQDMVNEVVDKVSTRLNETIVVGEGDEGLNVSKCDFNQPKLITDLDYLVVLSFMFAVKDPILVLRIFYDNDEEGDFVVIDEDNTEVVKTHKYRALDDFLNSGFMADASQLETVTLDLLYIDTKPTADCRNLLKSLTKTEGQFLYKEYRVLGHEKFKIGYYHVTRFESLQVTDCNLFKNRTVLLAPGSRKESLGNKETQLQTESNSNTTILTQATHLSAESLEETSIFSIGEIEFHKSRRKEGNFSYIHINTVTKPKQEQESQSFKFPSIYSERNSLISIFKDLERNTDEPDYYGNQNSALESIILEREIVNKHNPNQSSPYKEATEAKPQNNNHNDASKKTD